MHAANAVGSLDFDAEPPELDSLVVVVGAVAICATFAPDEPPQPAAARENAIVPAATSASSGGLTVSSPSSARCRATCPVVRATRLHAGYSAGPEPDS
jgi:hypothetical protein